MALIFDMDGVLVDNHQWHYKAWSEFGFRHGVEITQQDFERYFGSTNQTVLQALFGSELTKTQIKEYSSEKEAIYRELYAPHIQEVKGLRTFLERVRESGLRIALATSAPAENVEFTLRMIGLSDFFSTITDSSKVKNGKPDPEVYLCTAATLGVQPGKCVVFEDSIPGIKSAKSAGMKIIGVATTHKAEDLVKHVNRIIMNFETAWEVILLTLNEIESA